MESNVTPEESQGSILETIDDFVIQKICLSLQQQHLYHELGSLARTNQRLGTICQDHLKQAYHLLCQQPPTLITDHGWTQEWHDDVGRKHREGDLPAVILSYHEEKGPSWSFKEWWQHGQLKRWRGQPTMIYEPPSDHNTMVNNLQDVIQLVSIGLKKNEGDNLTREENITMGLLVLDLLTTPVGLNLLMMHAKLRDTLQKKLLESLQEGHCDVFLPYYQQLFPEEELTHIHPIY